MNETNLTWIKTLKNIIDKPDYVVSPRSQLVKELFGSGYTVPMPSYISLIDRNVNYAFMFAEAAWIIEGSNRLSRIEKYMKHYADYSDDGEFMRGAYGPKIVDQIGYVVDNLQHDRDSRQAYLNIWRERPGTSKDIPCTTGMQFMIRNGCLHSVVTMRSNDIVKGFTYDVFTFSMVAFAIVLSLRARGIRVTLGDLRVNAGSLHLYESDFKKAKQWLSSTEYTNNIDSDMKRIESCTTQDELIDQLWTLAHYWKVYNETNKN